jgi:hypothetical protein
MTTQVENVERNLTALADSVQKLLLIVPTEQLNLFERTLAAIKTTQGCLAGVIIPNKYEHTGAMCKCGATSSPNRLKNSSCSGYDHRTCKWDSSKQYEWTCRPCRKKKMDEHPIRKCDVCEKAGETGYRYNFKARGCLRCRMRYHRKYRKYEKGSDDTTSQIYMQQRPNIKHVFLTFEARYKQQQASSLLNPSSQVMPITYLVRRPGARSRCKLVVTRCPNK